MKLTELEQNINEGLAQLKKKLTFMLPQFENYDEIIEGKKKLSWIQLRILNTCQFY